EPQRKGKGDQRTQNPQYGSGRQGGSQIGRGDHVLDGGRSREHRHGKGPETQSDGNGNQVPGQVQAFEQGPCQGDQHKNRNEQADSPIGEQGGNGKEPDQNRVGFFGSRNLQYPIGDGLGGATGLDVFGQYGAQDEDRKKVDDETCQTRHIGIPAQQRLKKGHLIGEDDNDRADRCQYQDTDAPHRTIDDTDNGDEDAHDLNGFHRLPFVCANPGQMGIHLLSGGHNGSGRAQMQVIPFQSHHPG